MIEKFFKNPKMMSWVAVLTLVLIVALIWDSYKNPRKDFYGLLKSDRKSVV